MGVVEEVFVVVFVEGYFLPWLDSLLTIVNSGVSGLKNTLNSFSPRGSSERDVREIYKSSFLGYKKGNLGYVIGELSRDSFG